VFDEAIAYVWVLRFLALPAVFLRDEHLVVGALDSLGVLVVMAWQMLPLARTMHECGDVTRLVGEHTRLVRDWSSALCTLLGRHREVSAICAVSLP
jgi:hypothetical protein